MNPQGAPSAVCQYLKIPPRLCRFHDSKRVFLSRYRQLHRIVTSDLQKYARVWASFVSLSGRVQKSRTEAQTRCHPLLVAHEMSQDLQTLLVLGIHLDVAEDREIVPSLNARQMRLKISRDRLVVPR